jgi:alpha-1,2-mannosyltransferase
LLARARRGSDCAKRLAGVRANLLEEGAEAGVLERLKTAWAEEPGVRAIAAGLALLAALIAHNVLVHVTVGDSSLYLTRVWLTETTHGFRDSWGVMIPAYEWVKQAADGTLYQEIFFNRHLKFQYPPSSLMPLAALDALGVPATYEVLNAFGRFVIAATAAGVGAIGWIVLKRLAPAAQTTRWAAAFFLAGATLLYQPIMLSYVLGQVQAWLNALFVFACLAVLLEKRFAAGVLVGLVCVFKPQLGLFAIWALARRQWRFLGGMAAVAGALIPVSVALFGFQNHLAYFEVLSFMARHGEAYAANQSFNGLLHRALGDEDPGAFSANLFAPDRPLVYVGTLITSAAILAFAFWGRLAASWQARVFDFMLAGLAFTMASPIAWDAHYGALAPIFAALFAYALAMGDARRRRSWLIAIAACFAVTANGLGFLRPLGNTPLEPLQSYLLFAALGVLVLLWRASRAPKDAPAAGAGAGA